MADPSSQLLLDVRTEIDSHDPAARASRRLRIIELVLVLFVAFAVSVSVSIYAALSGASLYGSNGSNPSALNFAGLIQEVAALGVLFYVLFRQGRRLGDIGLTFS